MVEKFSYNLLIFNYITNYSNLNINFLQVIFFSSIRQNTYKANASVWKLFNKNAFLVQRLILYLLFHFTF